MSHATEQTKAWADHAERAIAALGTIPGNTRISIPFATFHPQLDRLAALSVEGELRARGHAVLPSDNHTIYVLKM